MSRENVSAPIKQGGGFTCGVDHSFATRCFIYTCLSYQQSKKAVLRAVLECPSIMCLTGTVNYKTTETPNDSIVFSVLNGLW